MFVGHYAPVFALRAVRQSPGLAAGFVAVQLVDIGFFSLSYFGIEKWAANPSLTGFTPVDLYFMPYTHSLIGSALWAAGAGLIVAMLSAEGRRLANGLIIAALVFSHWLLDLVVHRHDLALGLDGVGEKYGFALWDHPAIVAPMEIGLLLAGFALYMRGTQARSVLGKVVPWLVLTALIAGQGVNWFTPPAPDVATFSGMGLAAYFGFAFLALMLDRTRA
ncbi:MAG: hypothetical protein KBA31_12405 [Alphaproteobacteria bacterium]|nr:hypothetical protein [Alphaproteobacteria bacterium]